MTKEELKKEATIEEIEQKTKTMSSKEKKVRIGIVVCSLVTYFVIRWWQGGF